MQFDPYYTWLGIPPEESAGGGPNCYRLLGLVLFESNPDVIENAADRQMMHLRSFQTGIHAADSQRLLNEIASARIRLLDPAQKTAYDAELRKSLAPQPIVTDPALVTAKPVAPVNRTASPARARVSSAGTTITLGMIIVGGVAGLGVGSLVVSYLSSRGMIAFNTKSDQPRKQLPVQEAPRPSSPTNVPWNDWTVSPPAAASDESAPGIARDDFPTRIAPPNDRPLPAPPPLPEPPPPLAPAPANPPPVEEPPRLTYLFAAVPSSLRLPPLISSEPVPLLKLAREPEEPLSLKIDSSAGNLPAGSAITADADPQGRGWIVSFVTDAAAAAGKVTLAIIRREGLELSLAWAVPLNDSELRRQLANCLLEVGTVKDSRVLQLREPLGLGPLVLDLEKENQIIEMYLPDSPPPGKIALRIVELSGFDRGGKLRGNAQMLPLGKTAFIEFAEMKGAQVELRFVRHSQAGKLILRADPVFKEPGDKEFELTFPRLDKLKAAQEEVLMRAQNTLSAAQAGFRSSKSALDQLKSNPPRTPAENANWQRQVSATIGDMERLNKRIRDMTKQIAESQTRLNAVPDVRAFLDTLHKRATIRYIVSAECGDKEVVLVDGHSGGAKGQQ